MQILIDAHNLLHQDSELKILFNKDHIKAFEKLVFMIGRFALENPRKKIIVIFDGFAPEIYPAFENMYIEESGRYQTADDIIKDYIRSSVNPKLIKVITSDRELISFAKKDFCEFYRSEEFIHELRFLAAEPVEKQELKIYNQIKKEKKDKPLLNLFTENNLTEEDLDEMHLNLSKNEKNKIIKAKKSENKLTEKPSKQLELKELEDYFNKEKPAKKSRKNIQETDEFDKLNEVEKRFSDEDYDEMGNWFK